MTWDPRDTPFDRLTLRDQAAALWELAHKRRIEAKQNYAAGFIAISEAQIEQAEKIEFRARALELELRGK